MHLLADLVEDGITGDDEREGCLKRLSMINPFNCWNIFRDYLATKQVEKLNLNA